MASEINVNEAFAPKPYCELLLRILLTVRNRGMLR